jgi:hypothetical protein
MVDTDPLKRLPIAYDLQGNVITKSDLPHPDTRRWTANRKAVLVRAVEAGIISRSEALDRYRMEELEFEIWEKEFARYGADGLRITRTQTRRHKRDVADG